MNDKNRIQLAKDALSLFIRSLPLNCYFNVISFGHDWQAMFTQQTGKEILAVENNQHNRDQALSFVQAFKADMGGTNILGPVEATLA